MIDVVAKPGGRRLAPLIADGALYLALFTGASVLGQEHALDTGRLSEQVRQWADSATAHSFGGLAVVGTALLLASVAAALVVRPREPEPLLISLVLTHAGLDELSTGDEDLIAPDPSTDRAYGRCWGHR
ncbi:hypothetical protein ACFRAO_33800 [Streptomyces sp. NPDC056656]|uniref:hypothetical protein n=1 Tax=Streptomyces sp. NPDC056656 TaxID=3345895 RepID=UPI0036B02E33